MRFKLFWVLIMAVLFCFNVSGASAFEGKISQRGIYVSSYELENVGSMAQADKLFSKSVDELKQMAAQSGDDEAYSEETADMYVKGNEFLIETRQEGQRVTIIFDSKTNKMTTLLHEDKMAMVTDMNQVKQMGNEMQAAMGGAPGMMEDEMEDEDLFSMKATGETKTINGFACELYKGIDSGGSYAHMWIHKGYADVFDNLMTAFSKLDGEEASETDKETQFFKKVKGIPILTKSVSMGDLSVDEIVNISKQSVSSDMFKVPAGYQKMDMMEMMQQQMQQMQQMMQE